MVWGPSAALNISKRSSLQVSNAVSIAGRIKIGVLASGRLGLRALEQLYCRTELQFVLTDHRSTEIHEFCCKHDLPVFIGNPRKRNVAQFLLPFATQVLFSVNYLFLVDDIVLRHPSMYAINLHGSLLPKYRGRTPHVWAIINNETETGVTAHLMVRECDAGGILVQYKTTISPTDTGATILSRYESMYAEIIAELLDQIATNSIQAIPQDDAFATYFPVRAPNDGRINWSWQRERIYNWIRAQARPYPGAFFFFRGNKHFVHASRFSGCGFDSSLLDGTVLKYEPLVVKTPNGALELLDYTISPTTEFANATESPILE